MKLAINAFLPIVSVVVAAPVLAGQKLTQKECNDYPFKPLTTEVTHAQLMQDLNHAEARLQEKYRADCRSATKATNVVTQRNERSDASSLVN
jgi:hypothetical protein